MPELTVLDDTIKSKVLVAGGCLQLSLNFWGLKAQDADAADYRPAESQFLEHFGDVLGDFRSIEMVALHLVVIWIY